MEIRDERWYGRPSKYSYLRLFGCLAFAHKKGDKLEARAERCLMLGYAKNTKGYRLWSLERKKVVISRDVVFIEDSLPMLKDKTEGSDIEDFSLESLQSDTDTRNSNQQSTSEKVVIEEDPYLSASQETKNTVDHQSSYVDLNDYC